MEEKKYCFCDDCYHEGTISCESCYTDEFGYPSEWSSILYDDSEYWD